MPIETLRADATVSNSGCSSPDNAVGAPNGVWTANADHTNWNCRWSLANPTGPLVDAATQTVAVLARKSALLGNGNPTLAVDLYESGSFVKSLVATTSVVDTSYPLGTNFSGTFTVAEITNRDNLEVLVTVVGQGGQPAGRRNVQIDAITWTAEVEAPTVIGWGDIPI